MSGSWTLVGEGNAAKIHVTDSEIVIWKENKTLKLKDESQDDKIKDDDKVTDNSNSLGDYLMINTYYISLKQNETNQIVTTNIPEGYSTNDLIWTSSDTNIVDVSDGTIIARGSGNAVISVSTKDGKFKADCTVAVEADKVEFTPLKGDAI